MRSVLPQHAQGGDPATQTLVLPMARSSGAVPSDWKGTPAPTAEREKGERIHLHCQHEPCLRVELR